MNEGQQHLDHLHHMRNSLKVMTDALENLHAWAEELVAYHAEHGIGGSGAYAEVQTYAGDGVRQLQAADAAVEHLQHAVAAVTQSPSLPGTGSGGRSTFPMGRRGLRDDLARRLDPDPGGKTP